MEKGTNSNKMSPTKISLVIHLYIHTILITHFQLLNCYKKENFHSILYHTVHESAYVCDRICQRIEQEKLCIYLAIIY